VEVAELDDALAACEAAGREGDGFSVVAMTAANRRFHFGLFAPAKMPRLERQIRILWDATDVYRSVYYAQAANRTAVEREHRAILAAVRAGDAEQAVALLDEHRTHAVEHLRGLLAAQ
jgi:DNA-binding GntR family transcriptional regulator